MRNLIIWPSPPPPPTQPRARVILISSGDTIGRTNVSCWINTPRCISRYPAQLCQQETDNGAERKVKYSARCKYHIPDQRYRCRRYWLDHKGQLWINDFKIWRQSAGRDQDEFICLLIRKTNLNPTCSCDRE